MDSGRGWGRDWKREEQVKRCNVCVSRGEKHSRWTRLVSTNLFDQKLIWFGTTSSIIFLTSNIFLLFSPPYFFALEHHITVHHVHFLRRGILDKLVMLSLRLILRYFSSLTTWRAFMVSLRERERGSRQTGRTLMVWWQVLPRCVCCCFDSIALCVLCRLVWWFL